MLRDLSKEKENLEARVDLVLRDLSNEKENLEGGSLFDSTLIRCDDITVPYVLYIFQSENQIQKILYMV